MRALLRDRSTLLPLIVLLVQLVALQASVGAYASGRMPVAMDGWCIGTGEDGRDSSIPGSDCSCATLCAAAQGVGKVLPPSAAAGIAVAFVGLHRTTMPARPDAGRPRAPPPRAGPSRAPPTA